ncbi:hypothetical protein LCGC14_2919220, partial [marine sediment metagenome]
MNDKSITLDRCTERKCPHLTSYGYIPSHCKHPMWKTTEGGAKLLLDCFTEKAFREFCLTVRHPFYTDIGWVTEGGNSRPVNRINPELCKACVEFCKSGPISKVLGEHQDCCRSYKP